MHGHHALVVVVVPDRAHREVATVVEPDVESLRSPPNAPTSDLSSHTAVSARGCPPRLETDRAERLRLPPLVGDVRLCLTWPASGTLDREATSSGRRDEDGREQCPRGGARAAAPTCLARRRGWELRHALDAADDRGRGAPDVPPVRPERPARSSRPRRRDARDPVRRAGRAVEPATGVCAGTAELGAEPVRLDARPGPRPAPHHGAARRPGLARHRGQRAAGSRRAGPAHRRDGRRPGQPPHALDPWRWGDLP